MGVAGSNPTLSTEIIPIFKIMNKIKQRYDEIDFVRGGFVIGMIVFHFLYQLHYIFGFHSINKHVMKIMPFLSSGFFILMGISLYISYYHGKFDTRFSLLKRFLYIFIPAAILTISTKIAGYGTYDYFGVLHCMAFSTIIGYMFIKVPSLIVFILSYLIIFIGFYISNLYICDCNLIEHCFYYGLLDEKYGKPLDHFPLLPHLGFVLLGIYLGKVYYTNGQRQFNYYFPSYLNFVYIPFKFIGRHMISTYMLHVPIIFCLTDMFLKIFKSDHYIDVIEHIRVYFNK